MSRKLNVQRRTLFNKIRVISNGYRFRILELTETEKMSITTLSSSLKLSYTKCADYVRLLEKEGLVKKERSGKEVFVSSRVAFSSSGIKLV